MANFIYVREEAEELEWKWGVRNTWTEKETAEFRKFILKTPDILERSVKILVFGPVGHGKSSLCNAFRTAIFNDYFPSTYHAVSSLGHSQSFRSEGAQYGRHWIIDTTGTLDSKLLQSVDADATPALKPPLYEEVSRKTSEDNMYNLVFPKTGENGIACVVIVLKYNAEIGPDLRHQINNIFIWAKEGALSYHVVLTCLDECDPLFKDSDYLPYMHKSEKVQEAVQKIAQELGVPLLTVSFVKNYTDEMQTDDNMSYLHLRVLERIVLSAYEQESKKLRGTTREYRNKFVPRYKQEQSTTQRRNPCNDSTARRRESFTCCLFQLLVIILILIHIPICT